MRLPERGTYSIREAADALYISPETIRRYIARGRIQAKKVGPKGSWLISGRELRKAYKTWLLDVAMESTEKNGEDVQRPPLIIIPAPPEVIQVTASFLDLLSKASVNQRDLLSLTPRSFESLVAELWERFGYEVELTAQTRDGGRDVVAVKKDEADVRILIECKRYVPPRRVDVSIVRALYGVKADERATKAIIATTSTLSGPATRFVEQHRWELEARDHMGVIDWIQKARAW